MIKRNILVLSLFGIFTICCSAQQTEQQALESLRALTRDGKLPAEGVVADIENRFANRESGALAKLLRARIRFENKDFAGAAAILETNVLKTRTKVADHGLWLRGRALQEIGSHEQAMTVFAELLRDHPESVRARDAKIAWANSAIAVGKAVEVPPMLVELTTAFDADALLATAKAYAAQGSESESVKYYRKVYFKAPASNAAKEAEAVLTSLGQPLTPNNAEEQTFRADNFLAASKFAEAANAYASLAAGFPAAMTSEIRVKQVNALAEAGRMAEAQAALAALPSNSPSREQAIAHLVSGYTKAKQWPAARSTADQMRAAFPNGRLTPQTFINAGLAARAAKNRTDELYYFNTAVAAFPNAVEVADAQFESGWSQHEQGNFALASQMFIDHLARYADKNNNNRGKAGYWAARNSERTGKIAEACALYDALIYRYNANWYGYVGEMRFSALKARGQCRTTTPPDDVIARAAANLRTVTVLAETAGQRELDRAFRSEELSTIGLFDWAIDELNNAKRTANTSPRINLALAKHHRLKGNNVAAFLALRTSYPDYVVMFPEEMSPDEWDIFYPLIHWNEIKHWSQQRGLDKYQVAGLIRQESVFDPNARSSANAFGLMQLLVPTAQLMARKYGSQTPITGGNSLYHAPTNIELGTAYMKDQLARYGRIEYMSVAYNAGPGRMNSWRTTLPAEIDEFVEAIPFRETKLYVQGIIRNSAHYRRLYDENGRFRPNVGSRPLRGAIDDLPAEQLAIEFPELVVSNGS